MARSEGFWRWYDRASRADFGGTLLGFFFDWKAWLFATSGGVLSMFTAAYDGWSVTACLIAFVSGSGAFALFAAGAITLWRTIHNHRQSDGYAAPNVPPEEFACSVPAEEPTPDIDARAAYFQILESSEWRKEKDRTIDPKGLVYNWREVQLDREIHKALRNSRLAAWGEESLPGTATTPEKPIPPETWDKVEIVFDRSSLPRTAAHFKGSTSLELGRMAWVGVKFSKNQIFNLFPLENAPPSVDRIPITELMRMAVNLGWNFTSHDSLHLLDLQKAIRQGASDNHLTVWGRLARWSNEELLRNEILETIPPDHWRTFYVHLFPALDGDNFYTKSWTPSNTPQNYLDLHVSRREAAIWLDRDAATFKGKTRPEQRGMP